MANNSNISVPLNYHRQVHFINTVRYLPDTFSCTIDCFSEVATTVFQSELKEHLYPGVLFTFLHYYYTKNDNSDFSKFSPWLKSVARGKSPRSQFLSFPLYQKTKTRTSDVSQKFLIHYPILESLSFHLSAQHKNENFHLGLS